MNINFTSVTKSYYQNIFIGYKIIKNNITSDVPLDEANRHYQEIQEWIADGGTVIDNGGGE